VSEIHDRFSHKAMGDGFNDKLSSVIHAKKFCLTDKVKNFIFLGKINLST
jgi:hypothetical protein